MLWGPALNPCSRLVALWIRSTDDLGPEAWATCRPGLLNRLPIVEPAPLSRLKDLRLTAQKDSKRSACRSVIGGGASHCGPAASADVHAVNCSVAEGLWEVFPLKVLLPPTSTSHGSPWLIEVVGTPMDHEQNQGTPLTSLMHWDLNGELCSEDLERLLAQLLAQELSQQKQDQSSANRRREFVSPRARHPVK